MTLYVYEGTKESDSEKTWPECVRHGKRMKEKEHFVVESDTERETENKREDCMACQA